LITQSQVIPVERNAKKASSHYLTHLFTHQQNSTDSQYTHPQNKKLAKTGTVSNF